MLKCLTMFKRQTSGSVVCASCGYLVGVKDDRCYHCGRRNPGLFGFSAALRNLGHDAGFVPFVTGFCVLMYLVSMLVGGFSMRMDLGFLSPGPRGLFLLGESGTIPVVVLGRWWTVLSASWLHGGLLHIFFNLMWIRQLAPGVAEFYGPGRMVIVYVVGGAIGFLVSAMAGLVLSSLPPPLGASGLVVGASSSIFALLGALVYYGNRSGSRHVHAQALSWALSAFVIGLLIPYVDNYAHAGGFLGGYLVGRILDPLKQEQVNHIMIAVLLLALSVLSVIASVIHGIPLLPLLS
jgi:membrane associated rhomboid family serine protease